MAKFTTKYLKPTDLFDFKTHWAVGLEYPFKGSKGEDYVVEITTKGLTCTCTGMTFRGKCKHSESVAQRWRDVLSDDFEEKFLTSV
jgi:hypothetical protein